MKLKLFGYALLISFASSSVLYLLWKLNIFPGSYIPVLVGTFEATFGLALISGFIFGCQVIFLTNRSGITRCFDIISSRHCRCCSLGGSGNELCRAVTKIEIMATSMKYLHVLTAVTLPCCMIFLVIGLCSASLSKPAGKAGTPSHKRTAHLLPYQPAATDTIVRHSWKVAVMRKRIRPGMSQAQVHRILGKPSGDESYTMPGDVEGVINDRELYYGQGGPLYVCYEMDKNGGEVVKVVDTVAKGYYGIFSGDMGLAGMHIRVKPS